MTNFRIQSLPQNKFNDAMAGAFNAGFACGKVYDRDIVPGIRKFGQRAAATAFRVIRVAAYADDFTFSSCRGCTGI